MTRTGTSIIALSTLTIGALSGAMVRADVTFSHSPLTPALAPPPPNAVFTAPDPADLFSSTPAICSAPGPNLGNSVLYDNIVDLGLMAGDDVDAIHIERRAIGAPPHFLPRYLFSVRNTDAGLAGTAVAAQNPANGSDVFLTSGGGVNTLCVEENQPGLGTSAVAAPHMDGLLVQDLSTVTTASPVYFSLRPGSPTLAALAASPADILVSFPGAAGPVVAIPAGAIGLLPSDNVDGLILLAGTDGNGDGVFDTPIVDVMPMVIFSVSPASAGAPGTAVDFQATTDAPPGGDIFFSFGGGTNGLSMDDGSAGVGLADSDNIDALDLFNMSIPGEPPFDEDDPPPPPPPGCDVGQVKISICVSGQPGQQGYVRLGVRLQCPPPMGVVTIDLGVVCVPCDNANNAIAAVAAALLGAVGPTGQPVFVGPAVAVPSANPLQAAVRLNVNPAVTQYKLVSVRMSFWGCITMDLALLPQFGGDLVGLVDNVCELVGVVQTPTAFNFEVEGFAPVVVPLDAGTPADIATEIIALQLTGSGFPAHTLPPPPLGPPTGLFTVLQDPSGTPLTGVQVIGAPNSGLDEQSFQLDFTPPCPGDLNGDLIVNVADLIQMLIAWGPNPGDPADLNGDGIVNVLDLLQLLTVWGSCF